MTSALALPNKSRSNESINFHGDSPSWVRKALKGNKGDPTVYRMIGETFEHLSKCHLFVGISFTITAAVSAFVEDLNAYFVFPAIVSLFAAKFFKDSLNCNQYAQKFLELAKTHKITLRVVN